MGLEEKHRYAYRSTLESNKLYLEKYTSKLIPLTILITCCQTLENLLQYLILPFVVQISKPSSRNEGCPVAHIQSSSIPVHLPNGDHRTQHVGNTGQTQGGCCSYSDWRITKHLSLNTHLISYNPLDGPGKRRCDSSHFTEMRKPKCREIKAPARDHKASKSWASSNPQLCRPKKVF